MTQVILPQAFRASVPPLASVQIALLKNTSVAAVFGVAEAVGADAQLHQRLPDRADRHLRLLRGRLHRAGRDRLVLRQPPRATLEGGLNERERPVRRPRAAHRRPAPDLHVLAVVALVGVLAYAVWRLYDAGQFEYAKWEPFLTPDYVEALLVDGLLETLKMAFTAIIGAVVFGAWSSASASCPTTAGCAGRAGRSWSSSVPCRCCC